MSIVKEVQNSYIFLNLNKSYQVKIVFNQFIYIDYYIIDLIYPTLYTMIILGDKINCMLQLLCRSVYMSKILYEQNCLYIN